MTRDLPENIGWAIVHGGCVAVTAAAVVNIAEVAPDSRAPIVVAAWVAGSVVSFPFLVATSRRQQIRRWWRNATRPPEEPAA